MNIIQRYGARALFFIALLVIISLVGVGRLGYVQIVGAFNILNGEEVSYNKPETILAKRGTIYDNSGDIVFARSVIRYDVAIDQTKTNMWQTVNCDEKHIGKCYEIKGKRVPYNGVIGLALVLENVLGISHQQIAYDLYGQSKHKIIAANITPEKAKEVQELAIPFLSTDKTSTRQYPQGNLAGSLIGAAVVDPGSKEMHPTAGIEVAANDILAGKDGKITYEAGADGIKIPFGKETIIEKVEEGQDIKSSIDSDTQFKLQQTINAAADKYKANWTIGGVLRIKTGEVVALASNTEPNAGSDEVRDHGSKVMNTAFEPGSTMKVLTASGLINDGISSPEQKYTLPGYELNDPDYGGAIHDFSHHGSGPYTLAGVVGNSFNTGTIIASRPWGLESRYNHYKRLGIGQLSGSGFPGEATGILTPWQEWDGRSRQIILFGQSVSVSALQMMRAYATIANGGRLVNPTFISATRGGLGSTDNSWVDYKPNAESPQVMSEDAANKTMGILESCVVNSGCRSYKVPNYRIGGKTGTAEEPHEGTTVHSFIGVFPMDNPQYIVGVWLCDNQGTNITIESTAGQFKDISSFIIQKYGINPSAPAEYIPPAM